MGIPLIALLFVMESHYPKVAPQGFESFNVAFEFVKTPQQIDALFSNFTSITFSNINRATHLDFSLITLCSLFLLLYAIKTMKVSGNKWLFFVIPLAIIVFVANCVENIFLLKLRSPLTTHHSLLTPPCSKFFSLLNPPLNLFRK